ncbi:type II toxin-antitoxin system VapC family toxin [Agrobacterium rosae]|uniref:type II toxin-antitoxin system VapC family toxin n=1 Tax=Agrobacterium rosae TaxID=1972867 RepID=UPI003BA279A1
MPFVVDASIVAAWFLPDETNDAADKALDMLETEDAIAPDLLSHELRNILLSAEKRKRIDQDAIFSILLRFTNLPLTLVSGGDHITIMRLAKKHSLSATTRPIWHSPYHAPCHWPQATRNSRRPQPLRT